MPGIHTLRRGGSRYYVHPDTDQKTPSVTSILQMLPKPFLSQWAAKLTAENAVEHLGNIVDLALSDRDGAIDYLKGAPRRSTQAAADVGTQVHDLFEVIARGEDPGRVHPETRAYVDHIRDFHARYEPEYLHVEDVVWSETHDYAGSFDAIARIGGEMVILDLKTTRSGVHTDVALQLAAYAHADRIIDQTEQSHPMPRIDTGAVLHIRPERWRLVPVRIQKDVLEHFLHLRRVFDWNHEVAKTVLGSAKYDSRPVTASQRRAAS